MPDLRMQKLEGFINNNNFALALSTTTTNILLSAQQLHTMAAPSNTSRPIVPSLSTARSNPVDLLSLFILADAVAAQRRPIAQIGQHRAAQQVPVQLPVRPSIASSRPITEREHFLLFVKVLFKFIEQENNPRLRQVAKVVLSDCTRRNRMGDGVPLQETVERRLRAVVGEGYWTQAKLYVDSYCLKRGIRLVSRAATSTLA